MLIDSSHPRQAEAFAAVPALVASQEASLANRKAIAVRTEAGLIDAAHALPSAPQSLPLDQQRQWAALVVRPQHMRAVVAEDDAWAETIAQGRSAGSLGDIPLVRPCRRPRDLRGRAWPEHPGGRAGRLHLAILAGGSPTRSTSSRLVVAENSGHNVCTSEPGLVVDAISNLTATE